jgi:tetratricopeptide (TPR) repeat protein
VLERRPAEPLLLNYLGVLLYELMELAGAEAAFKAARRLDPALPHVRANLDAVRARRGATASHRLAPELARRVKALGARTRRLAQVARPAKGLTLSVCMIVKDEEEMLPGCLAPIRGVVDEIVIVDTGSSDRTVEIAESFGARVVHFPWNGSFADARNVSLEHATGDWVLQLDADEHINGEDAARLRDLLGRTWREAFHLVETHFTGGDDSAPSMTNTPIRLWRNRPEYRFEGRIHEQKTGNMPTYLPSRFETTTIRMLHFGYMRNVVAAKDKSRRNIELLEQEARENPSPFNAYNLGSEYLALADHGRARDELERAWTALQREGLLHEAGYVPLLVARLARACRESGDLAGAAAAIDKGLALLPDYTDLVLESALLARDGGEPGRAAALAERCLEMGDAPARYAASLGSGTYLPLNLLASLREAAGDVDAAEALHVRSLAEHPAYLAPILPLVGGRLRRGAAVADAIADVPADRPSAMLLIATALYEAGASADAEAWFRRVLERQPGNAAARIGLVEALLSQRRYADAVDEARREPADSPVAAQAAAAELFALAASGDGQGVLARLDAARAAGLPAHDAELLAAWAAVLLGAPAPAYVAAAAAGTAVMALEALLRVQEIDAFAGLLPVFAAVGIDPRERAELLARMYMRRGFLESAADEWIAVARHAPDARALLGLAQVAVAQGLPEDARELAAEAAALDPSCREAHALLAALEPRLRMAG